MTESRIPVLEPSTKVSPSPLIRNLVLDLPDAHAEVLLAAIESGPIGIEILRAALELRDLRQGWFA